MAPGYPGYGNYYDPAGSSGYTPSQSYTYQSQNQNQRNTPASQYAAPVSSSTLPGPSYQTAYPSESSYSRSWYDSNPPTSASTNTTENRAAETLNLLATQEHGQYAPSTRNTTTTSYENSGWNSANHQTSHAPSTSASSQQRSTSNTSPLDFRAHTSRPSESTTSYSATQLHQQPGSSSRQSYNSYTPETQYQPAAQQTSTSSSSDRPATTTTHSNTAQQYRPNSPYQQVTRAPSAQSSTRPDSNKRAFAAYAPNDNSPRAVAEASQSRANTLTPSSIQQRVRNAAARYESNTRERQTESVESAAPVTVDPTQVYDPWPEQQRKAQEAAEKRRKYLEAEQARKDLEQREIDKKEREEAAKKAEADRLHAKEAARIRAEEDHQSMEAAKALSRAGAADAESADAAGPRRPGETAMEAQMRQMFQKMREFNAANPAMLARLWEEERQAHLTSSSPAAASPLPTASAIAAPPQQDASPAPATQRKPRKSNAAKATPKKTTPAQPSSLSTSAQPTGTAAQPLTIPDTRVQERPKPAPPTNAGQPAQAVWPPGKKHYLAEAAAKWLNAKNQNLGKNVSVTANKIVTLLDANPSYITLCEKLESTGLTVDRAAFARALLQAVPDATRTGAAANPPNEINPNRRLIDSNVSTSTAMSGLGDGSRNNEGPAQPNVGAKLKNTNLPPRTSSPSLTEMYRSAAGQPIVSYEAPSTYRHFAPGKEQAAASKSSNAQNSAYASQYQRTFSPPRNKEEAARKRNLTDLLDLTNDSDNDVQYIAPSFNHVQQYPGFGTAPEVPPPSLGVPPASASQYAPASNMPARPEGITKAKLSSREAELIGKVLVQPIFRERVARKSQYDPRTIARDVLLATGRHPEMRTLNQHLMGMQGLLQKHSEGVELNKFDLGTIRWDLIDPGNPTAEGDDDDDERDEDMDADAESDGEPAQVAPTQRSRQEISHEDGTVSIVEFRTPAAGLKGPNVIKKRRGRPPRQSIPGMSQMRPSGEGAPQQGGSFASRPSTNTSRPLAFQTASTSTPLSTGRPSGGFGGNDSGPSSGPVGYAAFNQGNFTLDSEGKPVKRRGRPVGWRKSIHSKAAQGLDGSGSPSTVVSQSRKPGYDDQVKRRQGRPAKSGQLGGQDPEPEFNVYKCLWHGCNAELHNLNTLRRHIDKIHGHQTTGGSWICLWRGCGLRDDLIGKGKQRSDEQIESEVRKDWSAHMELDHVQPIARTLGDGPRSGLSDAYDSEISDAYMSDAMGRIITPRATVMDSLDEHEAEQSFSLAPVIRQGMPRVRGRLSEAQKEDELKLQQLEAKKRATGPFIDKGGCTLVNDHRRRGLYDDEDFEGEVSADDGPS